MSTNVDINEERSTASSGESRPDNAPEKSFMHITGFGDTTKIGSLPTEAEWGDWIAVGRECPNAYNTIVMTQHFDCIDCIGCDQFLHDDILDVERFVNDATAECDTLPAIILSVTFKKNDSNESAVSYACQFRGSRRLRSKWPCKPRVRAMAC